MKSGAKRVLDRCRAGARRLALITAGVGLAAAAFTAQGASARVSHDPCGIGRTPHVTAVGVHCGRIFEIPGHRTWSLPLDDKAPSCNNNNEVISGDETWDFIGLGGNWEYWTHNGEWILWNGGGHFLLGAHDQPINVIPSFHNWGGSPWQIRVYFTCDRRDRRG